jgi:hypothetical protein
MVPSFQFFLSFLFLPFFYFFIFLFFYLIIANFVVFVECTRDTIVDREGHNALISLVLVEEPSLQVTAAKALARLAEDGTLHSLDFFCFVLFYFIY